MPQRNRSGIVLIVCIVVAALLLASLVIGFFFFLQNANDEGGSHGEAAVLQVSEREPFVGFELTLEAIGAIPGKEETAAFSLSNVGAPVLSDEQYRTIEDAVGILADINGSYADASFALVNVRTGLGIARNADNPVYGASTIKAFYALYVCEALVETGKVALDDVVSVRYGLEADGDQVGIAEAPYHGACTVESLIRSAILYSDNSALFSCADLLY